MGDARDCRDAGIVPQLAAAGRRRDHGRAGDALAPAEPLSRAERLVLEQLPTPRTTSQIGAALFISPNTVKTHLRAIYRKLGAHSREEALVRARALGLLDDHPGDPLED